MDNAYCTSVLSLGLLVLLLCYCLTGSGNAKNKLPPSPPAIPIIGHLHLVKQPFHLVLSGLAARHGPVFSLRLGSCSTVVVSSPARALECLTEHDVTLANRPRFPSMMLASMDGALLSMTSYGQRWRTLRRVATVHLLSSRCVTGMSGVVSAEVHAMVRRVRRLAAASPRVQLRRRLFELSLSVLMETIVHTKETRPGSKEVEDDADTDMSVEAREFKKSVDEINAHIGIGTANLWDYLPAVTQWFDLFGARKKILAAVSTRDAFLQRLIDSQRHDGGGGEQQKKKKKSMISLLFSLRKKEPELYTDAMIKGMCVNLFSAGTGTTYVTIEWAMALLLNHPAALQKARDEMDELVGTSRLVRPEDVPRLTYLRCIINEALRLYPAAPLLLPHQSSADCQLGGYHVPRGTVMVINAYAIHRDPAMWEDPTDFRPERFQDGKAQGLFMTPFGMGRRKCPGEAMALRVVGLVLAALIQCFDWDRVDDIQVDMTEAPAGLTIAMAVPLEAVCRPRAAMSDVLHKL